MSEIDHNFQQTERASGTLLAPFALRFAPFDGALGAAREPWTARAWRASYGALNRAVDRVLTWHERAKMRHQLLMLDDHLLKDIGITRADALSESEKPFWRV